MSQKYNTEDIVVILDHPHGKVDVPLTEWIEKGPAFRKYLRPVGAKTKDGVILSIEVVPFRYRNNLVSRLMCSLRFIKKSW